MICPGCGEEKPVEAFAVDRSRKSGRKPRSKRCDAERSRAYYQANRERVSARVLARYHERRRTGGS